MRARSWPARLACGTQATTSSGGGFPGIGTSLCQASTWSTVVRMLAARAARRPTTIKLSAQRRSIDLPDCPRRPHVRRGRSRPLPVAQGPALLEMNVLQLVQQLDMPKMILKRSCASHGAELGFSEKCKQPFIILDCKFTCYLHTFGVFIFRLLSTL